MATLRDIADRLEISQTVVSRVLNGKNDVWASELTRQRILKRLVPSTTVPSQWNSLSWLAKRMQICVVLNHPRRASFEVAILPLEPVLVLSLATTGARRSNELIVVPALKFLN